VSLAEHDNEPQKPRSDFLGKSAFGIVTRLGNVRQETEVVFQASKTRSSLFRIFHNGLGPNSCLSGEHCDKMAEE
jgi:hypothetical protein